MADKTPKADQLRAMREERAANAARDAKRIPKASPKPKRKGKAK
jgi:hypothetical protein